MKATPLVSEPAMPNAPLCVRPNEAAAMLGVSKSTLSRLTKNGELECLKLKRAKMYPVAGLEAWVNRRKVPSNYSPDSSPNASTPRADRPPQ